MTDEDKPDDLTINGPDSPISLQKFIDSPGFNPRDRRLTVLLDQTGDGIFNDATPINITADECKDHALHLFYKVFEPTKKVPAYLLRHIDYMFDVVTTHKENYSYGFKSQQEALTYVNNDPENDLYKFCFNKLNNVKFNAEFQQVLGLIGLIAGSLNQARKNGSSIRVYIEHPETHLHPKKQAKFMTLLNELSLEFGGQAIQ